MQPSTITLGDAVWELPPLILHPFNERASATALLENSKAALMLSGVIPNDGSDPEELKRKLLTGRYSEIRMLIYIGRDVMRWVGQSLECASRIPELTGAGLRGQSFVPLLVAPPDTVKDKLIRWGVADYASIFCRSIGLNAIFAEPPAVESLAEEFLANYHRYADHLYRGYMESAQHPVISARNFRFELYASGEYSRMLESEWGE